MHERPRPRKWLQIARFGIDFEQFRCLASPGSESGRKLQSDNMSEYAGLLVLSRFVDPSCFFVDWGLKNAMTMPESR